MVSSVDLHHYGGESAVMAAPHPLELRRTHHHHHDLSLQQPVSTSECVGVETQLVSPRISSAARKRKEALSKKQHASSEKLTSKVAAVQQQLSARSTASLRQSQQQQHTSAPRSGRGAHSVDSFDPADTSDVSSLTNSVPASSISVSYAEALVRGLGIDDDGLEVEDSDEVAYMYCEDEVESLCRQQANDDEEDHEQRLHSHHQYHNTVNEEALQDASFDEEHTPLRSARTYDDDIPEELAGEHVDISGHAHRYDLAGSHEDDEHHMAHHEEAVHRLVDDDDDDEHRHHAYDDYDENDDQCLALSSVCSSPRRVFDLDEVAPAQPVSPVAPSGGTEFGVMDEIRNMLEYYQGTEHSPARHPFLAMEQQRAMVSHDRSDMHQEFCSKHYLQQQVSMLDRSTMIRVLLFEAHRHQADRRAQALAASDVQSDQQESESSGTSNGYTVTAAPAPPARRTSLLHSRGWQAVGFDVERTMTIEGPMSAQRKLSCMCIFNPHRIDPPVMENVDDERMRRLERQQNILRHIYQRPDNLLFADDIREGTSTPHPFATGSQSHYTASANDWMYQQQSSEEQQQDDCGFHPGYHGSDDDTEGDDADDDNASSDSDEGRPSWLTYEAPISIPLPSYAADRNQQRDAM